MTVRRLSWSRALSFGCVAWEGLAVLAATSGIPAGIAVPVAVIAFLVVPGISLMIACGGRGFSVLVPESVALAVGLSLATLILTGLLLYGVGIRVDGKSVAVTLAGLAIVCAALTSPGAPGGPVKMSWRVDWTMTAVVVGGLLFAGLAATAVVMSRNSTADQRYRPYVELSIQGHADNSSVYRVEVADTGAPAGRFLLSVPRGKATIGSAGREDGASEVTLSLERGGRVEERIVVHRRSGCVPISVAYETSGRSASTLCLPGAA